MADTPQESEKKPKSSMAAVKEAGRAFGDDLKQIDALKKGGVTPEEAKQLAGLYDKAQKDSQTFIETMEGRADVTTSRNDKKNLQASIARTQEFQEQLEKDREKTLGKATGATQPQADNKELTADEKAKLHKESKETLWAADATLKEQLKQIEEFKKSGDKEKLPEAYESAEKSLRTIAGAISDNVRSREGEADKYGAMNSLKTLAESYKQTAGNLEADKKATLGEDDDNKKVDKPIGPARTEDGKEKKSPFEGMSLQQMFEELLAMAVNALQGQGQNQGQNQEQNQNAGQGQGAPAPVANAPAPAPAAAEKDVKSPAAEDKPAQQPQTPASMQPAVPQEQASKMAIVGIGTNDKGEKTYTLEFTRDDGSKVKGATAGLDKVNGGMDYNVKWEEGKGPTPSEWVKGSDLKTMEERMADAAAPERRQLVNVEVQAPSTIAERSAATPQPTNGISVTDVSVDPTTKAVTATLQYMENGKLVATAEVSGLELNNTGGVRFTQEQLTDSMNAPVQWSPQPGAGTTVEQLNNLPRNFSYVNRDGELIQPDTEKNRTPIMLDDINTALAKKTDERIAMIQAILKENPDLRPPLPNDMRQSDELLTKRLSEEGYAKQVDRQLKENPDKIDAYLARLDRAVEESNPDVARARAEQRGRAKLEAERDAKNTNTPEGKQAMDGGEKSAAQQPLVAGTIGDLAKQQAQNAPEKSAEITPEKAQEKLEAMVAGVGSIAGIDPKLIAGAMAGLKTQFSGMKDMSDGTTVAAAGPSKGPSKGGGLGAA